MALITKDDVKAYLKLTSGTAEDDMLDHLIAAAISEIEIAHHRKFEYGAVTETFEGGGRYLFLQAIFVKKIHSIVADGKELTSSQYFLNFRSVFWKDIGPIRKLGSPMKADSGQIQRILHPMAFLSSLPISSTNAWSGSPITTNTDKEEGDSNEVDYGSNRESHHHGRRYSAVGLD